MNVFVYRYTYNNDSVHKYTYIYISIRTYCHNLFNDTYSHTAHSLATTDMG